MADKKFAKHFGMKSEVAKIFDDLEGYLDYCRDNMLRYDERDLYKTDQWRKYEKFRNKQLKEAYNG
jgi:hypothetical protein